MWNRVYKRVGTLIWITLVEKKDPKLFHPVRENQIFELWAHLDVYHTYKPDVYTARTMSIIVVQCHYIIVWYVWRFFFFHVRQPTGVSEISYFRNPIGWSKFEKKPIITIALPPYCTYFAATQIINRRRTYVYMVINLTRVSTRKLFVACSYTVRRRVGFK